MRDEIRDEASIEANTVNESQFRNMNRIATANKEKRSEDIWAFLKQIGLVSAVGDVEMIRQIDKMEATDNMADLHIDKGKEPMAGNGPKLDNRGWLNSYLCAESSTVTPTYTVKKAYNLLMNAMNEPKDSRSQLIWCSLLPGKIKAFSWRWILNRLPTKCNLA
ncbi:hypothetical protein Ancab_011360, partial [Ancistrocladus abbreviatus]